MHLLATTSTTLDEIVEPVDLGQPPGDVVVLSFADSDLSGLAAAWAMERDALPSVRLAHLRDLRHPMSVDLWIDRVGAHAKVILVRLLGGLDWWRYGGERLATLAREHGIALALLPGEDRDDPRLAQASTLPQHELDTLLRFFREGGRENLRALLRRLARHAGARVEAPEPQPVPRMAGYLAGMGAVDLDRLAAQLAPGRPVVPIIFYRALLLAADTAAIDALCEALAARGLAPAPLVITSLKEPDAVAFVRTALARLAPAVVLTTTAFAAGGEPGEPTPLDGPDVPVLQVVIATTKRAAWGDSARGLGAADLAMHVVLPELDGRVLAGAVAFKDPLPPQDALAFTALANRPEPDRIAFVADRVAALARLRTIPRSERRIAILLPDYPGAPGRAGYAVGLDVPASVLALLANLGQAGYAVRDLPQTPRALLDALDAGSADAALSLDAYARLLAHLPVEVVAKVRAAWGEPAADPDARDGAFRFRARAFGNILVALPPDRGRSNDRRADYHDPTLPPRSGRLRAVAAARGQGRCARAHGCARHARMAARQGGGADVVLLPRGSGRPPARHLSVHRQQSGRGRASQAPHRGRDHRPPAAAAGHNRFVRRGTRARAPGRRICAGRRPRPPAARTPGAQNRRDRAAHRPRTRSRRRCRPGSRRGAAPYRCLALRCQRSRRQGWPACLRPRSCVR
jgi:cobaltochelatase CobN